MGKYRSIAVIYGSDSSEWEVSCRSGEYTASRIDDNLYDVYEIFARFGKWSLVAYRKRNSMRVPLPEGSRPQIDKTDFSVSVLGEKVKFDYAYIMQHGAPGETGQIQGYLEIMNVPYSSCDSFVSAVAFDKHACKSYIDSVDFVKFAPEVFARKGMDLDKVVEEVKAKLQFPVFVKPTFGGSSFGISKVKSPDQLVSAINFAFSEGSTVIIEQGLSGRELTCAVYFDGEDVKTLPIIEIITQNDYFDYDAKYNGHSQEVCPAEISSEIAEAVSSTAKKIYRQIGCKGLVRIDFILAEDGLYMLEINTIPGMTGASLVPKMVRAAKMDITDFLTGIIESQF